MKRISIFIVPLLVLLLAGILATAVSAENDRPLNKASQITTDPKYDRNPSFLRTTDGTYWLFFTRGKDNRGIRDFQEYNPDVDYYDIYYRTARSISGLQAANENIIRLRPPDNAQRDISALQARDGKIWLFTSTGLGPGSERSVYYYIYDGKWAGPVAVPNTADSAAHVNALEYRGKIWVFFDFGYVLKAVSYDETTATWSAPVTVAGPDATVARAIVEGGKFYVVWTTSSGTGIYLSTSADGTTWQSTSTPIASWPGATTTNWDPVLMKDKIWFRLFWAPDAGSEGQFLATSTSLNPANPASWSLPSRLTTASYGSENWWDFWPQPCSGMEGSYLFYTSERNNTGKARTDANIWMMNIPLMR